MMSLVIAGRRVPNVQRLGDGGAFRQQEIEPALVAEAAARRADGNALLPADVSAPLAVSVFDPSHPYRASIVLERRNVGCAHGPVLPGEALIVGIEASLTVGGREPFGLLVRGLTAPT